MIAYIKELINTVELCRTTQAAELRARFGGTPPDPIRVLDGLVEELNRLDPRDFEPSVRHDFVVLRSMLRTTVRPDIHLSHIGVPAAYAAMIGTLLDSYAGEGSRARTRDFSFVSDPDVRKIVERDYRELDLRTFPDESWKSTVILAGSILEAVLYDLLTKDPTAISSAMASPHAPKKKGGVTKDITQHTYEDQWSLNDLINVACDLRMLPHKDERAIHLVLREYRNFVHPRLEVKTGITISEGHATAAKGMLDVILDHLTP
jgi:hypothetical protein